MYIGTDIPVRSIPFDDGDPMLHTRGLREDEWPVSIRFRKAYHKYVGSDQGDGGGFRHTCFVNGGWPQNEVAGDGSDHGEAKQRNHERLHALLDGVLSRSDEVELYICRDGDFMRPSARCAVIPVEVILDREFHFQERCAYTVISAVKTDSPIR